MRRHLFVWAVLVSCAARAALSQTDVPTGADEAFAAAGNLFVAGRFGEAASAYEKFAGRFASDGRAGDARFRQGEALFLAGNASTTYEKRAELYERSAAVFAPLKKDDPRAAFRTGNLQFLLGRSDEAAKGLRELIDRHDIPPTLAGAGRYFLARALLALHRADEARAVLAEARTKLHGVSAAFVHLASGDIEAARYRRAPDAAALAAALSFYRNALDETNKGRLVPETLFRIGELLRWSGQHEEALRHYGRAVEQYPTSPVVPYARLGAAWASLGRGDAEAARAAAIAARDGPKDPWLLDETRHVEGAALVALKRFAEAADALAPFLEREISDLRRSAIHRLAWAAVAARKYDLAGKAASALLSMDPPGELKAEANYVAAEVALGAGDAARAVELYRAAASAGGPTAALSAYRLASSLLASGDARGAAKAFDEFIAAHPGHALVANARTLAARSYLAAGEGEQARARFEEARADAANAPRAAELIWGASLAEYMCGNFDRMAALDREILAAHASSPRAADAAYWLAWSHLEKRDWQKAAQLFQDAANRALTRADLAAVALIEAAAALERGGDRDGAVKTALALLSGPLAADAPVEVALWTAQALRESDRNDEAQRILDRTLERAGTGPDRPRVMYALGQLALEARQHDEGLKLFDGALASSPPPDLAVACRIGRGICLAAQGRLAEAEVVFENVASQSAGWGHAAAYVELGNLRLAWAARSDGARRTALASKAAEDLMLVALLYEPEGPGDGARLCARALLGAARAYVFLERQASALDRIEQILSHPLYGALAEAKEARKLLQGLRLPAVFEERP